MSADNIIKQLYLDDANAKAGKLECQGEFGLVVEEDKDIFWQSLIFVVAKGVMACVDRASTNCLASLDNSAKWKKIVDPKGAFEGESLKIFAIKLSKRAKLSVFGPKIPVFLRKFS